MKSASCSVSLVFAGLLAASVPQPALAQSQIEISYDEPASAELRPIYEQLRAQGVLQQLQLFMEPLRLPKPLKVRTAECGPTLEPYTPGGPVTICYEVLEQVAKLVQAALARSRLPAGIDLWSLHPDRAP